MFPVIFQIGPVTVYAYGLMLAIAVMVCAFFLTRDAKQVGMAPMLVHDSIFWLVVSGILGARFFYILINFSYFQSHWIDVVKIYEGGLSWQGGLMGAMLASGFFIKKHQLPVAQTLDLYAPYIALGQAIGRLGCFLNGCCYGRAVSWGIYFPVHNDHLHPTQLYSTLGLLLIFVLLKKYQTRAMGTGKVFVAYLLLAPSWRFGVEFFRADHEALLLGLSVYQWVCIGLASLAIVVHQRLKGAVKKGHHDQ